MVFRNWKHVESELDKVTTKDYFIVGTGSGKVHVCIIKDNKLARTVESFRWLYRDQEQEFNNLRDFIESAD